MLKLITLAFAVAAAAGTANAQVTKQDRNQAALQKEAKISEATARATALREVPNGLVVKYELEREDGKLIYSYDISVPGKSGIEEVAVSAIDGSVVAHEHEDADTEGDEDADDAEESPAALKQEAKISEATARATALREIPNGVVKKYELEREDGNLIYSYDISIPGKSGFEEIHVSAIDGSVVAREHETPEQERAEAAKEAKEKKAKK